MPAHADTPPQPAARLWVVEACVASVITLPGDTVVARDDFHTWLWEHAHGLLGIDEGSTTADDAAAAGLLSSPLVIDVAAAPADRDWVAALAVTTETWWFENETSALDTRTLVTGVHGCRVQRVRAATPVAHEESWRSSFHPISVAGFGIVRPAWEDGIAEDADDGAATIFIDPGIGFGTGLHPTTQLCLAALAEWRRLGAAFDRVLDHGSGSGILGIAAAVLGAGTVDAVEIDGRVHSALRDNALRNGVAERIRVSDGLSPEHGPYDLVMANIVAPVLVEHATTLCQRLKPHGAGVVLSGLLAADVPEIAARYTALLGCRPTIREHDAWRCLVFRPR